MNKTYHFILDVDGVLNTGQFLYSPEGKVFKIFGPHDSDGLKMIDNLVSISFVSADKRGFKITEKRIKDMGYSVTLVTEINRYKYLSETYDLKNLIYMGDGIHDANILKDCFFGIAPKSARTEAKDFANFVTPTNAGNGAVLDACIEIKSRFFQDKSNEI